MATFLKRAESMLRRVRQQSLAETYIYWSREADYAYDPTPMTQAATEVATENGDVIIDSTTVDFLFESDGFDFYKYEPRAGDLIVDASPTYADEYIEYEVCSLGGGKCWRPHGRDGKSIRVHTKRIKGKPKRNWVQ